VREIVSVDPRSVPVRFSNLKHMARSPAHYLAALQVQKADTPAMRMGRFVHTLLLGGPEIHVFDGTRRGKAWDAFLAEHQGQEIATADEYDQAKDMADSVFANDYAMQLLQGSPELELHWSIAGRACKGRLDVLGDDGQGDGAFITELKTTFDAQPEHFVRQCQRMEYLAQLGWYRYGANAPDQVAYTLPRLVTRAFVVAVESTYPYVVTPCAVPEKLLTIGDKQWRLWFEDLRTHEEVDEWPGYVDGVAELQLPDEGAFSLIVDGEEVAA
jgi:PDDEXK-like domain of unknown function (DUF3799)